MSECSTIAVLAEKAADPSYFTRRRLMSGKAAVSRGPVSRRAQEGKAPISRTANRLPQGYVELLTNIKQRIGAAQLRAALAVNRELLGLYWQTGREIAKRQEQQGWGASVIDRLAKDLAEAFPGVPGLSRRNLWRMRAFYLAHPEPREEEIQEDGREGASPNLPQTVAEIPWGHHVLLLEKVKEPQERLWYTRAALENGWSRAVLQVQIEAGLSRRQGRALTNFRQTLPPPQSDLAGQALRDPYLFDFLTLGPEARERDLERSLISHLQRFLLELGVGFAFVGRQVHLEIGNEDFYIDLLFYHLKLRCYVVIELKTSSFRPEFVGKMNFYLSAVDAQLRHPDDQPTIGLLLCRSKDRVVVEYALRGLGRPIGVAQWETQLFTSLPEQLRGSLPSIEELEAELGETANLPQTVAETP